MKFKQVLAGLLVGTMVVTSAPVSGLGALSALAASEEATDSRVNLAAPNISATAPVAGESTDDAVTLDHSTTAQVFKDTAENPATLTSEMVQLQRMLTMTETISRHFQVRSQQQMMEKITANSV